MAVLRQNSWNSQQRVDIPHIRSIESAICADFDLLAGSILAGKSPLIIKGFTIPTTATVGNPVTNLILNVAGGVLLHYGASDSGTIFSIPSIQPAEQLISTNVNVIGSFNANSTNYIGLDLVREIDDSTADLVKFLDPDSNNENSEIVPLARTLNYRIVISTQNFTASTNVAPIAIVETDTANKVVSIIDARNMMFRLGSGGDSANSDHIYNWGTRTENGILYNSTNTLDPFVGEDKNINNFKSWADAVMTRLWEIGSGEKWYSPTTRDDVKILYGQPVIAATQDNFEWDSGTDSLTYSGIAVAFGNSPNAYYNTIVSDTQQLTADGQCLYVDLDRTTNGAALTTKVGVLETLGSPAIPGSRFVFAWRQNGAIYARDRTFEVGRSTIVATTSVLGIVKLNNTPADAANPLVPAITTGGGISVTATSGNTSGVKGTASGTGHGVEGISGTTGLSGVRGTASVGSNAPGVWGIGDGSGAGVKGSSVAGPGGFFIGGTDGNSVVGQNGAIYASDTGFKFPDSTVQATALDLTYTTGTVTPESGVTTVTGTVQQNQLKMVFLDIVFTASVAIAGGGALIGNITTTSMRPQYGWAGAGNFNDVSGLTGNSLMGVSIDSTGNIRLITSSAGMDATDTITIHAVYLGS